MTKSTTKLLFSLSCEYRNPQKFLSSFFLLMSFLFLFQIGTKIQFVVLLTFWRNKTEKKETLCNRWEWQSGEYFVHLLGPLEILMDSQTMTLSAYGMELPFRQSVAKIPSERTAQVSGIRWTRTNNITKNNCWLSREKNFIDRDSHSRCSSTWKSEVFFSSLSLSWKRKKGDKNYFYDQYFRSIEQECLSDSYVLFSLFSVDT